MDKDKDLKDRLLYLSAHSTCDGNCDRECWKCRDAFNKAYDKLEGDDGKC